MPLETKGALLADIASMRELANMTARNAIATDTSNRMRVQTLVKTTLFTLLLAAAAMTLSNRGWQAASTTNNGLALLVLSFCLGADIVRGKLSVMRIRRPKQRCRSKSSSETSLDNEPAAKSDVD